MLERCLACWLAFLVLLYAAAPCLSLLDCGKGCKALESDGADQTPHFRNAIMDPEVTEILLTAPRYQLKPSAWAQHGGDQLYVLRRNLTVRSTIKPYGLLDFQLLERKVLLAAGVTVRFQSIVLQNIRKLGSFNIDFFAGDAGSQVTLTDVIRVKLACQQPQHILQSARTFQRVSDAFPLNNVSLIDQFCFSAALTNSHTVDNHCFSDSVHFTSFSMLAVSNDPDAGNQFPGYILYQKNTTRVCQNTITRECEAAHGEEICLAMLVAEASGAKSGQFQWTSGAIAGVAIAGAVVVVALAAIIHYRHHVLLWCVRLDGKTLQDLDSGSSQWVTQHAIPCVLGQLHEDNFGGKTFDYPSSLSGYTGRRAISQQVTLGVLLGAGSFGRVYKGHWHSSDVAIKIMSCTRAELPKVLREAEVMMQLNHPNIVRAFHASVWNPAEQMRALQAREARSSGSSIKRPPARPARRPSSGSQTAADAEQRQQQQRATSTVSPLSSGQFTSGGANTNSVQDSNAAGPAAAPLGAVAAAPAGLQDGAVMVDVSPLAEGAPWQPGVQPRAAAAAMDGSNAGAGVAARCLEDTAHHFAQGTQSHGSQSSSFQGPPGPLNASNLVVGASAAPAVLPDSSSGAAGGSTPAGSSPTSGALGAAALSSAVAQPGSSSDVAALSLQPLQPLEPSPLPWSSGPSSSSGPLAVAESREAAQRAVAAATGPGSSNAWDARQGNGSFGAGGSGAVSPSLQATATPPAAAAAAAASAQSSRQGSLRQHLLGKLVHRSSSFNSQRAFMDSAGPSVHGMAAATAPAAAAAPEGAAGTPVGPGMAVMYCPEQDQDSGRSRSARRQQQQPGGAEPGVEDAIGQDDDLQRSEVQVWIVLELCTGGTLGDAITTGRLRLENNIDLAKMLSRLLETANGMTYLHSKGVMHGDLKAGNVLLQHVHGTFDQVAKISDFGLAAVLLDGATHRSTASMGTITHMAPEVLRSGHMSPAADVYSFGIMMWEVFTNQQAYQGLHYGAVVERVVIQKNRPPIPPDMPEEFSLLMSACWDAEPVNRPSFAQIGKCLEIMLDNLANGADDQIDAGQGIEPGAELEGSTAGGTGSTAGSWQQQQQLQQQQPPALQRQMLPHIMQRQLSGSSLSKQAQVPLLQQQAREAGTANFGVHVTPKSHTLSACSHLGPASQVLGSGSNLLDESQYLQDL